LQEVFSPACGALELFGAASFLPAAAKLTAPRRDVLERDVQGSIDKAYAACIVRQRNFDRDDYRHVMATPFIRASRGRD
jgi:hypothetical protein